jgi:hypothetical protein
MRRALLLGLVVAVGLAAFWVLRPRAPSAATRPSLPRKPAVARWFDFTPAPTPEAPVTATPDAGPAVTFHFRGRTALEGKGVRATVHAGDDTFDTGSEGAFAHAREVELVKVWAERGDARSRPIELKGDTEGEVWLELVPVTRVSGVVLDAVTRRPIEGAAVALEGDRGVTSGGDGHFELAVPSGPVELVVGARGYLEARRRLTASPGADFVLHLQPRQRFAGVVVDGNGRPAGEARLRADPVSGPTVDVRARDDGSFEFWAEAPVMLVGSSPDGLSPMQTVATPREDLRVVLQRSCRLAVEVTLGGKPLERARVSVATYELVMASEDAQRKDTDAKGQAELGPMRCGARDLEVEAEGMYQPHREAVVLAAGRSAKRVALERQRTLEGHVVDARSGQPIDRAEIVAFGPPRSGVSTAGGTARSDAGGRFTLWALPPGELDVRVSAIDHVGAKKAVTTEPSVDFALDGEREIRGRALDARGQPLRQILVSSSPVHTEAGVFHHRVSPTRTELTLSCERCLPRVVAVPDPGDDLGDVTLEAAPTTAVLVLRPDGAPAAGASVQLVGSAQDFVRWRTADGAQVTDGLGRAELLVEPELCVRASAPGFSASDRACPAPSQASVTLTLRTGAFITGVVRARGQALAAAVVMDTEEELVAVSGSDGHYELGPLSPGRHELFWLPPGVTDALRAQRALVEVNAGERVTRDLGSRDGSRVEVLVRRDLALDIVALMAGTPRDILTPAEGGLQQLTGDGEYRVASFEDVPPGSYTLFVPCTQDRTARRIVVVSANRDERVVIDSAPAASDEGGDPSER